MIKAWLQGHLTVLDLKLGVKQSLLDSVVNSLYTRKLQVDPRNVESLLLLADYLQVGPSRPQNSSV